MHCPEIVSTHGITLKINKKKKTIHLVSAFNDGYINTLLDLEEKKLKIVSSGKNKCIFIHVQETNEVYGLNVGTRSRITFYYVMFRT